MVVHVLTKFSETVEYLAYLIHQDLYVHFTKYINEQFLSSILTTGDCIWLDVDSSIKELMDICRELFPVVSYAYSSLPTYPCGTVGYVMASNNPVGREGWWERGREREGGKEGGRGGEEGMERGGGEERERQGRDGGSVEGKEETVR